MRVRLYEGTFPYCSMLGMSEAQFWQANPRKIKVWEKIYKDRKNDENLMCYRVGVYVYEAVATVATNVLRKKGAKRVEYLDKPIRIFPMTEEEKEQEQQRALQQAIRFFDGMANEER